MRRVLIPSAALMCLAVFVQCSDRNHPVDPWQLEEALRMDKGPIHRPVQWSLSEINNCQYPAGQIQSVYPLDAASNLFIMGRICWPVASEDDFRVFDMSSGEPVLVASLETYPMGTGFHTAAHSPDNASIGFAGHGNQLIIYDGAFQMIEIPGCNHTPQGTPPECTVTDVWAASATDVWITTGLPGTYNGIWHYDGEQFTQEYAPSEPAIALSSIWGVGDPPQKMFAVGDGILERSADGMWSEVTGLDLADCTFSVSTGLYSVVGRAANDFWASGFGACAFHYDGAGWSQMPVPEEATSVAAMWPLDPRQILAAGQGGVDLAEGRVALWGSVDGGQSWTQFSDPAFSSLRETRDAIFFTLAANKGGNRIFAPSIQGTLLLGTPQDLSKLAEDPTSLAAKETDAGAPVLPIEQ